MKPCRRFRKPIALHAAAALEPAETRVLRQHLAECPACQRYLDFMQTVCGEHRQAALLLAEEELLADGLLHRVSQQLDSCEDPRAPVRPVVAWLPRLAWPVAALAIAALLWRQIDPRKTTEANPTPLRTIAVEHKDSPSSHMTYRLALNQSFEQLDRLLAKTDGDAASEPAQSLYESRLELAENGF